MKEKVLFIYDREAKHYEGLQIREGGSCIVRISNYNLQFCDTMRKPIFNISLKEITNVAIVSDKELVEKNKSVIARGIVGNVLFGGAGLILGGLSGVQKKQVMENIDYLVINYRNNDEDKVVSVYAKRGVFDKNFMKGLNNAIDKTNEKLECPNCGAEYNFNDLKCSNCKKVIKNERNVKMISGVIVFAFIFVIFSIVLGVSNVNKDANIIQTATNMPFQEAKNIDSVLEEVGISNIKDMTADSDGLDGYEGKGSKGYRIKTDFSDNVIMYLDENNNVICIRYMSEDYYRNGKVLKVFE